MALVGRTQIDGVGGMQQVLYAAARAASHPTPTSVEIPDFVEALALVGTTTISAPRVTLCRAPISLITSVFVARIRRTRLLIHLSIIAWIFLWLLLFVIRILVVLWIGTGADALAAIACIARTARFLRECDGIPGKKGLEQQRLGDGNTHRLRAQMVKPFDEHSCASGNGRWRSKNYPHVRSLLFSL
jgi:hypothetical protein